MKLGDQKSKTIEIKYCNYEGFGREWGLRICMPFFNFAILSLNPEVIPHSNTWVIFYNDYFAKLTTFINSDNSFTLF